MAFFYMEGTESVYRQFKFNTLPYFFAFKNGKKVDQMPNGQSPIPERFFAKFATNRWYSHRLMQLDESDCGLKKLYQQQEKQKGRTIILAFMEPNVYARFLLLLCSEFNMLIKIMPKIQISTATHVNS